MSLRLSWWLATIGQAIVEAIQWLCSFRRLWTAAWRRHSERTADLSSSLESAEAAVEFVLREHRLDRRFAVLVELMAGLA
jgi:hypothetical protein